MKNDISNRKLFFYTVTLYMIIPVAEIYLNLFVYTTSYSKVSLTFAAKLNEALNLMKFDIALYIILIFLVYLAFALINYKLVIYTSLVMSKMPFFFKWPIKGLLFFIFNGYFFMMLYYLNATLYPFSKLHKFAKIIYRSEHYQFYFISALALLVIYLLALIYVFLRYGSRFWKILVVILLGGILLSNLDAYNFLQKVFSPSAGKKGNTGPNVIIIGIDSLNPQHTGYFGYPYNTTPHLDKFLQNSYVFKRAFTPQARTSASWFSILTGQYPRTNGMRYNLMNRQFLNPESETITNYLKNRQGYHTAHFTDETRFCNLFKEDGFSDMGHPSVGIKDFLFGNIHDFSITNVFFNNPLGYRLFKFMDINRAVYHLYRPEYFTNRITSYLSSLKAKERFVFIVHHCAPHWPYQTSYPYPYLFADENNIEFSLYDGALRMADDQFGKLISSIKKSGFYDNSLIIVLSDHGETTGGHGNELREPGQNRILLAVKAPGQKRHAEIEEQVRTIDLAPTILDVLGLSPLEMEFDGSSFAPWLQSSEDSIRENRAVFMETGFSIDVEGGVTLGYQELLNKGITFYEFNSRGIINVRKDLHDELIRRKQRAIQTGKWKLVLQPDILSILGRSSISLYSLTDDPECEHDVSSDHPDITARLLKQLKEFYQNELDADGS